MKTFLITGATGFFGRSVVEDLVKCEDDFIAYCTHNQSAPFIEDPRIKWVSCDLLRDEDHSALIAETKPTHLLHLAWHVPPGEFWSSPLNTLWRDASLNLFKAFCEGGGQVFIGAGTIAEYAWSDALLEEDKTPLEPSSLYGQCKKALHADILSLQETLYKDVYVVWPRIGYFFGEHESEQKLMSRIVASIKEGAPLHLLAPGASRPYAHVRYLGRCYRHCLFQEPHNAVFHLSAGMAYSFKEIVDYASALMARSAKQVSYGDEKDISGEVAQLEISTQGFKRYMGYEIEDTFFEDLEKFIHHKSAT